MKRNMTATLKLWKSDEDRKPLLLQGARQVGKTHLLKSFSEEEYARQVYLNFEEDPSLPSLFEGRLNPKELLVRLSRYARTPIEPHTTLLIFDEIQHCNRALNSLKYLAEEAPNYHVVAAGSLLGVQLSRPGSFPVGKVNLHTLCPMTFNEFLVALQDQELLETICEAGLSPLPAAFHHRLLERLASYFFVGGMPEAVATFVKGEDLIRVRRIHRELLTGYQADFGKHAPKDLVPKLNLIWQSIPAQLGRENKKFIYSAVAKGARARGYEDALEWLAGAGLIHRARWAKQPKLPFSSSAESGFFKVYLHDTGLLGALSGLNTDAVATQCLFDSYRGALVENYVAQQLTASDHPLYYWKSKATAEIDFLVTTDSTTVLPLESKSGVNPRSKSLQVYQQRYAPPICLRVTPLNLRQDGNICNIPLYAINDFERITQACLQKRG